MSRNTIIFIVLALASISLVAFITWKGKQYSYDTLDEIMEENLKETPVKEPNEEVEL